MSHESEHREIFAQLCTLASAKRNQKIKQKKNPNENNIKWGNWNRRECTRLRKLTDVAQAQRRQIYVLHEWQQRKQNRRKRGKEREQHQQQTNVKKLVEQQAAKNNNTCNWLDHAIALSWLHTGFVWLWGEQWAYKYAYVNLVELLNGCEVDVCAYSVGRDFVCI